MPHYLTDYFVWVFVRRTSPDGRSAIELWRCEEPRGELCLYMSHPRAILDSPLRERRPLTRNERILLTTMGSYRDDHADLIGTVTALAVLDHGMARVLCNEIALDAETGTHNGDELYRAVLRTFCAVLGENHEPIPQEGIEELLQSDRYVWGLAGSPGEPPMFKLVGVDRFFQVVYPTVLELKQPQPCITFDFTSDLGTDQVMELTSQERLKPWGLLSIFPSSIGNLISAWGAIAQCGDPYRFEALKVLIAHAAALGWQSRPTREELAPIPLPDPSLI